MRTTRVYLDTSVFMAELNKKDPRHPHISKFFTDICKIKEVELCTSKWALTELVNRLTKDEIDEYKIEKYRNDLLDKNSIRNMSLKFVKVSPGKIYDFDHFFSDLTSDLIKYKTGKDRPGLGDILHIRIMKNNRINIIITFDSHFDFIKGFTCINPQKTKVDEAFPKIII